MYIMVASFILFISFVQLYREEDACKMKTYEFRDRFVFILQRRLLVLHDGVIKLKSGAVDVFSQKHFLGLK